MEPEPYRPPASVAQRSVWLLDQLSPHGTMHVLPVRIGIDGPVDIAVLEKALASVVARHDTLRTTFQEVDGQPVQVIGTPWPPLSYEDLQARPDPDAGAAERLTAMIQEPFDLETGPLVRARLLRLGPERFELTLVAHQIAADRDSFALLVAELATAYAAGDESELPDLPIRYGEFARSQAARPTADAYWREALDGAPQLITLPMDRSRPAERLGRGARVGFTIDVPTAAGLRDIARSSNTTIFATLLAVYATVLSRYTGRDDILIGTPVSGRTDAETRALIGAFADTLPLRIRTAGHPTFAALVDRVRDVTAEALAHQETPFDHIVAAVVPEPTLDHPPLIQVLFAVGEPLAPVPAGPVTFRPSIVDNGAAEVDFALDIIDSGGALAGRLTYDSDLFDLPTAESFVDCLLTAARSVAADPQQRVAGIELLAPVHLTRILDEWGTGPALTPPEDLVTLLTGALRGDDPVIVAGETMLSRDEVVEWSGQIAAALADAGVGVESSVGLCLSRGAALVPAMLGVWMAGAGYVPLDPGYPAERLRMMVADSGIRVVLTQSSLAGLVRGMVGAGVTVVRVDAPDLRTGEPAVPVTAPPEALAYTIFTSGSTGRPKGVAVPRGAVAALLRAFEADVGFTAADTLAAVTTLSFDIAVLELLLPVLVGGRVVIADAATAADGPGLHELLRTSRATALQATPATWRMLAAVADLPAGLRLRLCGGEALPPDLVDVLTHGDAEAWNVYGPTETTVWSAAGRVRPSPAPVEVGPPIAGTRLLVLDDALRLVPPGVVGEVYIGGAGMSRGYHGRAGLTAERFLPDPYAGVAGARMYRTGDLARWRPNGRLDLLGRVDHQVKLRGFRIETGEIEAILDQHDSVAHAVVTAYTAPGATDAANLVAYVVPADGMVETAALRRHLQTYLPDYMIPAAFVSLIELPLTPNGKVDRARLPQPEWGDDSAAGYVPPATEVQTRLVEMWTGLLPDAKQIGIHDNFFALGGHSLIAIQLTTRLRAEYGVKLALRKVFTNPTIGDLATIIEGMLSSSAR